MPIIELILQATGSRAGTCFISLMLAICFIHGTNGSVTSASRLLYAMARDKGIVFHDFFSHISPTLEVPVRTIMLSFVFNAFFGLLYLGPTVAFNAFIASCTIFLNASYAFPLLVIIIRGRKTLTKFQTSETPWRLGERRGLILNWISVLYVGVTSVVSGYRHHNPSRLFADMELPVLLFPTSASRYRKLDEYVVHLDNNSVGTNSWKRRLRFGRDWNLCRASYPILARLRENI